MGELIYSSIASLDGHIADADGRFDWGEPDAEVHAFVNDLARPIGTHLLGRRMYEVMSAWDTMDLTGEPPAIVDFAEIWRDADKIVYSTTLDDVTTGRTRLERSFDPAAVADLKASSDRDLAIAGPTLAAGALRAGLVDEIQLVVAPVVVGGGVRCFPDDVRLDLRLVDERRFAGGMAFLRYRAREPSS